MFIMADNETEFKFNAHDAYVISLALVEYQHTGRYAEDVARMLDYIKGGLNI